MKVGLLYEVYDTLKVLLLPTLGFDQKARNGKFLKIEFFMTFSK